MAFYQESDFIPFGTKEIHAPSLDQSLLVFKSVTPTGDISSRLQKIKLSPQLLMLYFPEYGFADISSLTPSDVKSIIAIKRKARLIPTGFDMHLVDSKTFFLEDELRSNLAATLAGNISTDLTNETKAILSILEDMGLYTKQKVKQIINDFHLD